MSEMHFRDVNARVVQFADVINNHATPPAEARVENGYRLLDLGLYDAAQRAFAAALHDGATDQELHFGLALAQLDGLRPHRQTGVTIRRVIQHLQAAPDLPHALFLELLVAEDYGLYWRRVRRKAVPRHVNVLAAGIAKESAQRILRHVPAPEARSWQALYAITHTRTAG
jgi:hypothetical protein